MKKTINFNEFRNEFRTMNRESNFSVEGLEALYEYLTDYESETGEELELDVIELCCEFTEYTADELVEEYYVCSGGDLEDLENREDDEEEAERLEQVLEYLEDRTMILKGYDCYIVQIF